MNAKVIVSKSGQLSLQSESEEVYHLSESSTLEIWREQLVLLQGTVWVQAQKNEEKDRQIETVNGFVEFKKSEFVLSYDEVSKKSQIFVISGHASIANIFMREKKELLVSGEISFVQKDFQQGMPRRPSLIGQESLAKVFSQFKGIKPGDENFQNILNENESQPKVADSEVISTSDPSRSIASVGKGREVNGIYYIPKSFSAPKREHPIKPRVQRSVASVKSSNSVTEKGNRPIRVFDYTIGQKFSTWNALLGVENNVTTVHQQPVKQVSRSVSSLPSSQPTKVKTPSVETTPQNEPDFDSLMKDLKGVSSQHNEVY